MSAPKKHAVKVGSVTIPIYETRDGDRVRFTVCWYEGKVRKRAVRDDLAAAKALAGEKAIAVSKGRTAALSLTHADHESYAAAMRELGPLGVPLNVAIAEYVAARKALPAGVTLASAAEDFASRYGARLVQRTVAECVAEFVASKKRDGLHGGYLTQLEQSLTKFADAFKVNIGAVQSADVQQWIRKRGGAPKSQNHYRAELVSLANFARDKMGALPKGETQFHRVDRLRQNDHEIGILTPGQMTALLTVAVEADRCDIALWLALGGFAGLRPNECLRLHWEEIDLARGYIRVKGGKSKTGSKRLVPLADNLKAWLPWLAARVKKTTGLIFTRNADQHAQYFAKKRETPLPFDGLRHSFGTYRVAQLADTARVAHEMGNSPRVVVKHYDKVALPEEGSAWFGIMPEAPANVTAMRPAA